MKKTETQPSVNRIPRRAGWKTAAAMVVCLGSSLGTRAAIIVQESFTGTQGQAITTRSPDWGLNDWSGTGNLSFDLNVPTDYPGVSATRSHAQRGGAGGSAANITATLQSPLTAGGSDFWVGYLARMSWNGLASVRHVTQFQSTGNTTLTQGLVLDGGGGNYNWTLGGLDTGVSTENWSYIVYHFRLSDTPGADEVDMYINPDATLLTLTDADPSHVGTLSGDYGVDTIYVGTRGGSQWDEIRIATEYRQVVAGFGIPEPSSMLLLLSGATILRTVRRHRTR